MLVASVGVATVSFACSKSSEHYETMTSGNLIAVPSEASVLVEAGGSVDEPAQAGPADAGGHDPHDRAPEAGAPGDEKGATRRRPIPTTGNLVPPPKRLDLR